LSPEIIVVEGADAVQQAEGSTAEVEKAGFGGPSGVGEQGTNAGGPPGTWEVSTPPPKDSRRRGGPAEQVLRERAESARAARGRIPGGAVVPLSEGNEVNDPRLKTRASRRRADRRSAIRGAGLSRRDP